MLDEHLQALFHWISEREAVRLRKGVLERQALVAQEPGRVSSRPKVRVSSQEWSAWGAGGWSLDRLTHDPVLREFRFCNVRRADDRVTRWIVEHISEPFADHEHLWFMLCVARYINWPPTLQALMDSDLAAWPSSVNFEPVHMTAALEAYKAAGNKVETAAYMIRAESDRNAPWYSWSKQRYVAEVVLGKLWERKSQIDAQLRSCRDSLQSAWKILADDAHYTGWGPFMTAQWVTDLRHTSYLRDALDINTWAAVGPGSRRGLNRLYGRALAFPLSQSQGLAEMVEVREQLRLAIENNKVGSWVRLPELSDIQNCMCEVDKYLRVLNSEGRPRSRYVPGRGW